MRTKKSPRSTFLDGYATNFETLKRAVRNGDLALIHCSDKATGKPVAVLAAMQPPQVRGGEITIVPLGKMFDGNPYEELLDPIETMVVRI